MQHSLLEIKDEISGINASSDIGITIDHV